MGITVSALAEELGSAVSSITRLVSRGMPALPDGTLDRDQCLRFIAGNTSGSAGGWSCGRRGKKSLAERAAKLLGIKSEFDFSELSELSNSGNQAGKQPAVDEDREKRFFYDYGYASGTAYLARCLRDPERIRLLADLAVDLGIDPKLALEAVGLFAYMSNAWIVDLLGETLGKKYAKEFKQELAGWVKSLSKADKASKAAK